jgi:nucleoside-diphosphate-sugar epimerase
VTRVLLTGASGFIGRHTAQKLTRDGHQVHAVGRGPASGFSGERWHTVDLLDGGATAATALVDEVKPELLVHLAWYATHGKLWTSPENVRWVESSLALLRAFADAGGRRAVIAGTCAEYDWSHERLDEDAALRPATLYGASKHGLHTVARAFCEQAHVELAWGRVFFLYGPDEDPRRLVASVVLELLRGEPARTTAGTQRRDFMHAADAGAAFAALAESEVVGAVNIASGRAIALRDLAAEIAARIDRAELQLGAIAMPDGDPPALLTSARRLREEVGFEPQIELDEGIEEVIEWWRGRLAEDAHDRASPASRRP